jgi:replicative DNA helicase
MVGGVSFGRLRTGQLTPEEEEKLFKAMRQRAEFPDFWMSADSVGASTVSGIAGKIEQYRPDVVFIDGVYLMQDDQGEPQGTPRALTNITRALKRLAQKIRLPFVVTTQVLPSRYNATIGLNTNSVAYSSSFAQDSDVVLGIEQPGKLSIVISRNSPQAEVMLHWDWETGTLEEMGNEEDEDYANSPL